MEGLLHFVNLSAAKPFYTTNEKAIGFAYRTNSYSGIFYAIFLGDHNGRKHFAGSGAPPVRDQPPERNEEVSGLSRPVPDA